MFPESDMKNISTAVLSSWLQEDEGSAQRYREYHYGKQWEEV